MSRNTRCPACGGAALILVDCIDLDGAETRDDRRCAVCGSPHALQVVFQVVSGADGAEHGR